MIDWQSIQTVLLDMDGTLLDLRFDNHFWLSHLPRRYAERQGLSLKQARTELGKRFGAARGTLHWYCLDHWSAELGLPLAPLKDEVAHLIAPRPGALAFLEAIRSSGRRAILVTNAHPDSLTLKLRKTRLDARLDAVISAHTLGLPKEEPAFWNRLQAIVPHNPRTTLFIDDNADVLVAARRAGLGHLLLVSRPDSTGPMRASGEFPLLHRFEDILPAHP